MMDVLCVGNAVADTKARPVDSLPATGTLALVDSVSLHGGGCALNTALALAKLGMKAGIVTGVGHDAFGEFLMGLLKRAGVDNSPVVTHPVLQSSATAVMVNRRGERSFLHTIGASAAITEKAVPDSLLRKYRALHLSGFYILPRLDGAPAMRVLRRAKKLGLVTSLDTCWDPRRRWHLVRMCLPYTDYYMPSYEEAREAFGSRDPRTIAEAAFRAGVRKGVILKTGAKGCFALFRGGAQVRVPAFKVKVVDTTGAGDCFDAGFLAGLLRRQALSEALMLGCAAGACSVSGMGSQGTIRSYRQVAGMTSHR
jgi:sugar/nucleoside kinase (ribokinase family)